MTFRLLDKTDLNIEKWNTSIRVADNGRVNALAWYLDIVCDGKWKALVNQDYSYVLPLPFHDKIPFLKRIYVPYYSQQMGIIGKLPIDKALISLALEQIPSYRQVIMQWNEFNTIPEGSSFEKTMRPNYVLALNRSIESIRAAYSKNLKRHLKKTEKRDLIFKEIPLEAFEKFFLLNTAKQTKLTEKFKILFGKLIRAIMQNDCGMIRGVYVGDRLLAACLFTKFNKRLTSVLIRSNEEGKKCTAMHFLMDQVISNYADQDYLLDFEGSSIESVARFFKSFGAKNFEYPLLRSSRFPF